MIERVWDHNTPRLSDRDPYEPLHVVHCDDCHAPMTGDACAECATIAALGLDRKDAA